MASTLAHTRPALGQVSDLGTLYDARKDTFHGASIIRGNPPPGSISSEKIGSHSAQVSAAGTAMDRLTSFGVDNDIAASFIAGFVPTSGSAMYLQPSQHKEGTPVGDVHYEILTESTYLNLANPGMRNHITTIPLMNNRSTHIVTGITYGVKFILGARPKPSDANSEHHDITKKLHFIKSMFNQHENLYSGDIVEEAQGSYNEAQLQQEFDDVNFCVFSDILGMSMLKEAKPKTVGILIRQIPTQLEKTNHGRGVPLTYHLMPLEYLRRTHGLSIGPRVTIRQPPGWVLEEFASTWEKWNNLDLQIKDFIRDINSISFMFEGSGLQKIYRTARHLVDALKVRDDLVVNFASTLETLRGGLCSSDAVEKLLDEHLHSDTSPERIVEILSRTIDGVSLRKALASRGGHYYDYEDAQDAISTGNSIYIMFFTEDMRRDNQSWKESQDIITRLLKRNSGGYNVAVAECQPTELSSSRPRISHYVRGEVKTMDMLETMDLADQCFVRRCFNSDAPEVQPAPQDRRLVRLPCPHPTCDKDMNILVLGESGVGKSTFINAFYNYMMFDSLDEAMNHEKLEYAIPSSFTIQHYDESQPENGFVECNVKIGDDDEERDGSSGQSATQSPTVYRVQIGDRLVRLIDTPGIGDTRGEEFDKINMSKVLSTLNRFSNLHGVIILVKPNNARLNVVFKFCVQELLTHLHRDAVRNIVWGFTNTRQSNYGPGDSMKPLKALLSKHDSLGLRLTPKNVFCFDSESFRCLAAKKQAGYTMNNLGDFRRSWDRSTKQTRSLLEHVDTLQAHRVKSTLSINRAREIIHILTQPMADITDSIERTIRLNQDKIQELSSAQSKGKSLQKDLHFKRIEIDVERLQRPRTVCKHPACVDTKPIAGVQRPIYRSFCHDPCYLSDVDEDVVGHANLTKCAAFGKGGNHCDECEHHWQQHLHIRYTQTERVVEDIDADIQAKLDANASDVVLKKEAQKVLKKKISESQASLKEIQDAAIEFGLYLKKKSIAPYNDAMIEYLDLLINDEKRQISHSNACGGDTKKNEERLDSLKENKQRYAQRIKVLDTEMSKSDENGELLDEQGVDDLVQKLYSLEHYGKDLQAMREMVEWSKTSGFREQELRPRLGRGMATLSWLGNAIPNTASAFANRARGAVSSVAGGLLGNRGTNTRTPAAPQESSSSTRRPNARAEVKTERDQSADYQPRGMKRGRAQAGLPEQPERYNLRERRHDILDDWYRDQLED